LIIRFIKEFDSAIRSKFLFLFIAHGAFIQIQLTAMLQIQAGDKVRHKKMPDINGGLAMNVSNIKNTKALCDYFEGEEVIHKQDWFDTDELEIVIFGEGGFRNAGE
jgi:hypothetical protein